MGIVDGSRPRGRPARARTGGPWPRSSASIVPWKSRWSWLRLVNTATAKRVAVDPVLARACDDTSIATARRPSSRNGRQPAWRSGASGVVRDPVSVPITPVGRPAASRIEASRWVTVVLPFVPVTPTTASAGRGVTVERGGDGRHRRARVGHDHLGTSRSSGCSTSSAVAPAATAAAAKWWPSACSPADAAEQRAGHRRARESWGSPRSPRPARPGPTRCPRGTSEPTSVTSPRASCPGAGSRRPGGGAAAAGRRHADWRMRGCASWRTPAPRRCRRSTGVGSSSATMAENWGASAGRKPAKVAESGACSRSRRPRSWASGRCPSCRPRCSRGWARLPVPRTTWSRAVTSAAAGLRRHHPAGPSPPERCTSPSASSARTRRGATKTPSLAIVL